MAYDPQRPESIFDGDNCFEYMIGLCNAAQLRYGRGGDLNRPDVGVCMVALEDANAELKHRPVVSMDCRYNDHQSCEGQESALWPDGDFTIRRCSCPCHERGNT
jgi:hypothetical protein